MCCHKNLTSKEESIWQLVSQRQLNWARFGTRRKSASKPKYAYNRLWCCLFCCTIPKRGTWEDRINIGCRCLNWQYRGKSEENVKDTFRKTQIRAVQEKELDIVDISRRRRLFIPGMSVAWSLQDKYQYHAQTFTWKQNQRLTKEDPAGYGGGGLRLQRSNAHARLPSCERQRQVEKTGVKVAEAFHGYRLQSQRPQVTQHVWHISSEARVIHPEALSLPVVKVGLRLQAGKRRQACAAEMQWCM
jgi:hypothetical protein